MKKRVFMLLILICIGAASFAQNSIAFPESSFDLTGQNYAVRSTQGNFVSASSSVHHHHHYHIYSFSDLLIDLIDLAWILNNFSVNFDTYPYAHGSYVLFEGINYNASENTIDDPFADSLSDDTSDGNFRSNYYYYYKPYRYEAEMDVFYMFNAGRLGLTNRFEGFFWKFFGPVIENDVSYAFYPFGREQYYHTVDGSLRVGLQLALFQSSPLSLSAAFCYDFWYGNRTVHGIAWELIFRSYPIEPLTLEDRIIYAAADKFHDYGYYENPIIIENIFEVGFMIEHGSSVTLAYKYYHDQYRDFYDHGISVGAKYYF